MARFAFNGSRPFVFDNALSMAFYRLMKFYYENEADIPEDQKADYAQTEIKLPGGTTKNIWVNTKIEGAIAKPIHDSFRENNTTLLHTVDTLTEELKPFKEAGVDVVKYKKLTAIEKQLDDKQLVKLDKFDEAVAEQTKTMRAEFETKDRDQQETIKRQSEELSKVKIDQEIIKEVTKQGAQPWAVEDLVRRGRDKFVLEDGKVVAYLYDEAGKRQKDYSSKKGGAPTISEWAEDLVTSAPGYFKENRGSDADPSKEGGDNFLGNRPNPWKQGSIDLTLQGQVERKDSKLAKRLRQEAGVKESAYATANASRK